MEKKTSSCHHNGAQVYEARDDFEARLSRARSFNGITRKDTRPSPCGIEGWHMREGDLFRNSISVEER